MLSKKIIFAVEHVKLLCMNVLCYACENCTDVIRTFKMINTISTPFSCITAHHATLVEFASLCIKMRSPKLLLLIIVSENDLAGVVERTNEH